MRIYRSKKCSVASALAIFCLLTTVTTASTIGLWRFEEGTAGNTATGASSVLDSASTNHGSPSGDPTYSSDLPLPVIPQSGLINTTSLSFDGVGDTVLIPTNAALNSSSSFTVEFWMRSSDTSSGQHLLVDKSHGFGDTTGWFFQSGSGNGIIAFGLGNGSSFPGISSSADLFDDTWHHLAGTYDGTTIEFFVDGTSQGSLAAGTYAGNTRDIRIGSARNGGRFFDGGIDELRISDTVLAPSEFLNVPEPSSVLLIGFGSLAFAFRRKRR